MALEVVGSTPITHPTKYIYLAHGNTYHGMAFWDVAKLVRHRILIPAFAGSSPAIPANFKYYRWDVAKSVRHQTLTLAFS